MCKYKTGDRVKLLIGGVGEIIEVRGPSEQFRYVVRVTEDGGFYHKGDIVMTREAQISYF